jgi:Domain of unknown function (DUF4395)
VTMASRLPRSPTADRRHRPCFSHAIVVRATMFATMFTFPNPVNEKAARTVAFVVMLLAALMLATSWYWLLVPLAYGFLARAGTGPTLSPLGRLASSVIAPRLGPGKPVPGPPKRFAQAMGAVIASAAAIAALGFSSHAVADGLLVMLIIAAGLESIFAFCVGCRIFGLLMRVGLVPDAVCTECADIWGPRAARP